MPSLYRDPGKIRPGRTYGECQDGILTHTSSRVTLGGVNSQGTVRLRSYDQGHPKRVAAPRLTLPVSRGTAAYALGLRAP